MKTPEREIEQGGESERGDDRKRGRGITTEIETVRKESEGEKMRSRERKTERNIR